MSGQAKRLSNYEPGDIPGINVVGESLAKAVNKVSEQPGLMFNLNVQLLIYWVEQGVEVYRLYADGHTKIFFTRHKSLSGKMSGSERIGAGTGMVIVQQQDGLCLWLQMHQINEHLGRPFIEDSLKVLNNIPNVEGSIPLITDREGSAQAFSEEASELGLPLVTLLKPSCYHGLQDFMEDPECPGYWKWVDPKKFNDGRRFKITNKQDGNLLIYSINYYDPDALPQIENWYKGRWNSNENPLRTLNQQLDFNVNTGQKVAWIDNPKQIDAKIKAKEKLPKLKVQLISATKKKPRKAHRIYEKQQKLVKLNKQIDKSKQILAKPLEKVAVKDTQADFFVSIFKNALLNTVLSLLMAIAWPAVNAQEAGFVIKAIIRRKGDVKVYYDRIELALKPMHRKEQRLKQEKLIRQINEQRYLTKDGKLIKLGLLSQREKIPKNSSYG